MSSTKERAHPQAPRDGTKLHVVLKQLQAKNGSTVKRLCKATGWQAHSVRAALTGLRKRGYTIARIPKSDGETRFGIDGA